MAPPPASTSRLPRNLDAIIRPIIHQPLTSGHPVLVRISPVIPVMPIATKRRTGRRSHHFFNSLNLMIQKQNAGFRFFVLDSFSVPPVGESPSFSPSPHGISHRNSSTSWAPDRSNTTRFLTIGYAWLQRALAASGLPRHSHVSGLIFSEG